MNIIQKYFVYRQSLIDQYVQGDMTKNEYLRLNFEAVQNLSIEPFQNINSIEKALYNYHYYNAHAKNMKMQSNNTWLHYEQKRELLDQVSHYYYKKDSATLAVLRLLDYQGVSAYFIKVKSSYLKGKLFEMVIQEYKMILHSPSKVILNKLREAGIFSEETKTSLIDMYINQKY